MRGRLYLGVMRKFISQENVFSESSRKKLVKTKMEELNNQIGQQNDSGIPAVQGTESLADNPEMMQDDLLIQEDGATECFK